MSRYRVSEKSDSKKINDAVKHTKRRKMKCATTDLDFDREAKRRFDENYEAIFGKKDIPHGTD